MLPPKGRGASSHPANRFEQLHVEPDPDAAEDRRRAHPDEPPTPHLNTLTFRDDSQSVISTNNSPDLALEASLNPYRGCEHGCAYCYARPYHEYLGFNAGLDFESRIMVKENAPELLTRELNRPSWKPKPLVCSGVTDPYQPVERKLKITRRCLEVLAAFRNPVAIITKNHLVTRDIDLLGPLAQDHQAAAVFISIPSLDPHLSANLEPRASSPKARLRALQTLADAGIPVGVSLAPRIPGLNDHETPAILKAAAEHGAKTAFYTLVRLPHGVKNIFANWLNQHRPGETNKILDRIRETRDGKLNDSNFKSRMRGKGPIAQDIATLFKISAKRYGLDQSLPPLSTASFHRQDPQQPELFPNL
ncbi:MAG: PA0069 family radical SAM protein [Verrucomicrobiota bacterium]